MLKFSHNKLDQETAIRLYQCMLKIRMTEEKIAEIYPSDKIQSPIHLCVGQEAVSAGVAQALEKEDHIYGSYRGHGIYLAKGGDLRKLFAELYGKATGYAKGKGGSMHAVASEVGLMGCTAIVASQIPVATGDALASRLQGRPRIVAVFFGDGAVDEGVFFESINFAMLKGLPILYVCENNHYAIHSTVSERHKQTELFRIGEGLGLAGRRFEGNDVTEVYSRMKEACQWVKEGRGPLLLEFMTYRWCEHVGPRMDHGESYRDQEKLKQALHHHPLQKAKQDLVKKFGITEEMISGWTDSIRKEIEKAVVFAEESPFPSPESLYEDVYAGAGD